MELIGDIRSSFGTGSVRIQGTRMALTISAAARQWRVSRETLYRRQLAGVLSFATTDPPTVETSEMRRVFGEPKPKSDHAVVNGKSTTLARVNAVSDMLKAEAECLKAKLVTIKQELDAAHDDARKEHERWLDLQQLVESSASKSTLVFEPGEAVVAQAVLAAQQRVKSEAGKLTLLEKLRLKK